MTTIKLPKDVNYRKMLVFGNRCISCYVDVILDWEGNQVYPEE